MPRLHARERQQLQTRYQKQMSFMGTRKGSGKPAVEPGRRGILLAREWAPRLLSKVCITHQW